MENLEILPLLARSARLKTFLQYVTGCALLLLPPPAAAPETGFWPRLFQPRQSKTIVASDYIFSTVQEAAGWTLTLGVSSLNSASDLERLFPNIAPSAKSAAPAVVRFARNPWDLGRARSMRSRA